VLPEPVLFEVGKAKLKDSAKKILTEVGKTLALTRYDIVVEGHSCDSIVTQTAPAGKKRWQLALERSTGLGPYYSNRELSGARALQVMQFFIKEKLISPERLSANAYGPTMPLVPNTSEENRIKNRRIEIKIAVTKIEKT
jgi:chemotaxis protein MotB